MPPPKSKSGLDSSKYSPTCSSEEKAACQTSTKDNPGLAIQIIRNGKMPRTTKTATSIPQNKKNLRYRCGRVFNTCAFTIALSILLMISKRDSPKITINNSNVNIKSQQRL